MPTRIELPGLLGLLEEGAQLAEVLPREEYVEEHLPGAISIPLRELDGVMEAGPSAVRPDVALAGRLERLQARELARAIATTPEGKLVGVVRRADTETRSSRNPAG